MMFRTLSEALKGERATVPTVEGTIHHSKEVTALGLEAAGHITSSQQSERGMCTSQNLHCHFIQHRISCLGNSPAHS